MILQNFVPHQSYYGREPAEIADAAAREYWRTGVAHGPQLDAPAWATPVTIEDMKRLIAETRRLMPEIGIQVPPNLSDWWLELVRAGATDLGGLSANGDHISPEHPFPVAGAGPQAAARGRARADRAAVRVPGVHRPGVDRPAGDGRDQDGYWSFIPRRGSGRRAALTVSDDLAPRAVSRAREGLALSPEELTALFAERRPAVIEEMRARPMSCAASWPARR